MFSDDLPSLFQITEVELVYRNPIRPTQRRFIKDADDAFDILINAWDLNKIDLVEQFKILLLDRGNRCLGISEVSTGGITSCIVDPRIVFATALKAKATSMILAHNHPSRNLTPSHSDVQLTEKLVAGGKLLEIKVEDHLIVTPLKYYSMREENLMLG